MEIHDNSSKTSSVRTLASGFKKKRRIKYILIFLAFVFFSLGCVVYGGYLNKTRQNIKLGNLIINLVELDFTFIQNTINSVPVDVEKFDIDIKFENVEKLRYRRSQAVKRGSLIDEDQEKVPARIRYLDEEYRVDVSLTGATDMHFCHPNKWSLSVKVKKGKTIMGMRKFAILVPRSRGYLTDWIATTLLKSRDIIGIRSDFVEIGINGDNLGLYYIEERYDKRLLENNKEREGLIFKIRGEELFVYGLSRMIKKEELHSQYIQLKKLWHSFLNNKIGPNEIFDLQKMASFAVVTDIMNEKHALAFSNIRFYFNPVTGMCEPIGREWGYLREPFKNNFISLFSHQIALLIEKPNKNDRYHNSLMKNAIFNRICNLQFKEYYVKEADKLSRQSYLDSVLSSSFLLETLLNKVHQENPFYKFPQKVLYENQKYMRTKIYPHNPMIEVALDYLTEDSIFLFIQNKTTLPIEIHNLYYNSISCIEGSSRTILDVTIQEEDVHSVAFPIANCIDLVSFSTDSLEVSCSVLGMTEIKRTVVFPKKMIQKDFAALNYARQPSSIGAFLFLNINQDARTIEFPAEDCNVAADLVIPEGYVVSAKPGCRINLSNSARIISYSPILFFGTEDSLITITSSDRSGQGLVVFNCSQNSELSYVSFRNLSNISDSGWDLRGAITFYKSNVNVNNSIFSNNLRGDDYLNIIGSEFRIVNTTFENTKADAFDSDFSTGIIENVSFLQVGNDAIDVSRTELFIDGANIVNPGDKGISGGEGSYLICKNIKISGGEIAVASKDNTTVEINGISIKSSSLAYCAYQKKPEYGPGVIIVKNAKSEDVKTEHLIEVGSSLLINGEDVNAKNADVKQMLYGAEYGKASK